MDLLYLVIWQIPPMLWKLKPEFKDGCIKLRKLRLKTEKLSDFRRQGSKLFDSIMVDGNKIIFEKWLFGFKLLQNLENLSRERTCIFLEWTFSIHQDLWKLSSTSVLI